MALDFFTEQQRARRRTAMLVGLFTLGLLAVMASASLASLVIIIPVALIDTISGGQWTDATYYWFMAGAGGAAALLVLGGSWWKVRELRKGGGPAIAEILGATPVSPQTTTPGERKLLNVVEEMAIASGLPVPLVFLMRGEEGINAFVAGYHPHMAVLAATQGCIDLLTRDELQGVVGHEFSHILNGDMRLNLRLVGLVHGIMLIGLTGYGMMRASVVGSDSESASFAPGLALGFLLMVVGYGGTFFGNCIKAAVSRQREFLADASAVQFTRNPGSILGALLKIGGYKRGSNLEHPKAPMVSHMLFGRGVTGFMETLLATHPPVAKRLKRLDPDIVLEFPEINADTRKMIAQQDLAEVAGFATGNAPGSVDAAPADTKGARPGGPALDAVGGLTQAYVLYARDLIRSLPAPVRDAARVPDTARAVVHGLLILHDPGQRAALMDLLLELTDLPTYDATDRLLPHLEHVPARARLPLLDLCIPALREMTPERHQRFMASVRGLVSADKRMDLMEWMLLRILKRHLAPFFKPPVAPQAPRHATLAPVAAQAALLLCVLARLGARDTSARQRAFAQGAEILGLEQDTPLDEACTLKAVGKALDALNGLDRPCKGLLLKACARCIMADTEVTVEQGELLRAVADSLDCPMPPLLPGQPLA